MGNGEKRSPIYESVRQLVNGRLDGFIANLMECYEEPPESPGLPSVDEVIDFLAGSAANKTAIYMEYEAK